MIVFAVWLSCPGASCRVKLQAWSCYSRLLKCSGGRGSPRPGVSKTYLVHTSVGSHCTWAGPDLGDSPPLRLAVCFLYRCCPMGSALYCQLMDLSTKLQCLWMFNSYKQINYFLVRFLSYFSLKYQWVRRAFRTCYCPKLCNILV